MKYMKLKDPRSGKVVGVRFICGRFAYDCTDIAKIKSYNIALPKTEVSLATPLDAGLRQIPIYFDSMLVNLYSIHKRHKNFNPGVSYPMLTNVYSNEGLVSGTLVTVEDYDFSNGTVIVCNKKTRQEYLIYMSNI